MYLKKKKEKKLNLREITFFKAYWEVFYQIRCMTLSEIFFFFLVHWFMKLLCSFHHNGLCIQGNSEKIYGRVNLRKWKNKSIGVLGHTSNLSVPPPHSTLFGTGEIFWLKPKYLVARHISWTVTIMSKAYYTIQYSFFLEIYMEMHQSIQIYI